MARVSRGARGATTSGNCRVGDRGWARPGVQWSGNGFRPATACGRSAADHNYDLCYLYVLELPYDMSGDYATPSEVSTLPYVHSSRKDSLIEPALLPNTVFPQHLPVVGCVNNVPVRGRSSA